METETDKAVRTETIDRVTAEKVNNEEEIGSDVTVSSKPRLQAPRFNSSMTYRPTESTTISDRRMLENGSGYGPECILEHRFRRSQMQFLVQWKSLSAGEATWVRSSDLQSYLSLIESYFQSSFQSTPRIRPQWMDRASESLASYKEPSVECAVYDEKRESKVPTIMRPFVIWEPPRPSPLVNPFIAVIGTTILHGKKYFSVVRSKDSIVYMDRDALIATCPSLLVDYLEKELSQQTAIEIPTNTSASPALSRRYKCRLMCVILNTL